MFYQLHRFSWWITHLSLPDLFAFVTLVLSVATLAIVGFQVVLMVRQTGIMQRQDEILAADRSRRSRLDLLAISDENLSWLKIGVQNSGNRTARGYYWHLFIPVDVMEHGQVWQGDRQLSPTDTRECEGRQCRLFSGYEKDPLYPTRQALIAKFRVSHGALQGEHPIFWSIISEDGANPEKIGESNKLIFRFRG